eukprot:8219808-Alexandrium_andersonii.AAC.1
MATRTSPKLDWGSIWTIVRAGCKGRTDNVRGGRGKQRVARKLPLFVAPTVAWPAPKGQPLRDNTAFSACSALQAL